MSNGWFRALLLICATFGAAEANAQPNNQPREGVSEQVLQTLSGTTSVESIPQFSNGRLWSCGVEFSHIMRTARAASLELEALFR
jgi:hypothetical protein